MKIHQETTKKSKTDSASSTKPASICRCWDPLSGSGMFKPVTVSSYCSKVYQAKTPFIPKICIGCNAKLTCETITDDEKAKNLKYSLKGGPRGKAKNMVFFCSEAENVDNDDCMSALCRPCFAEKQAKECAAADAEKAEANKQRDAEKKTKNNSKKK